MSFLSNMVAKINNGFMLDSVGSECDKDLSTISIWSYNLQCHIRIGDVVYWDSIEQVVDDYFEDEYFYGHGCYPYMNRNISTQLEKRSGKVVAINYDTNSVNVEDSSGDIIWVDVEDIKDAVEVSYDCDCTDVNGAPF